MISKGQIIPGEIVAGSNSSGFFDVSIGGIFPYKNVPAAHRNDQYFPGMDCLVGFIDTDCPIIISRGFERILPALSSGVSAIWQNKRFDIANTGCSEIVSTATGAVEWTSGEYTTKRNDWSTLLMGEDTGGNGILYTFNIGDYIDYINLIQGEATVYAINTSDGSLLWSWSSSDSLYCYEGNICLLNPNELRVTYFVLHEYFGYQTNPLKVEKVIVILDPLTGSVSSTTREIVWEKETAVENCTYVSIAHGGRVVSDGTDWLEYFNASSYLYDSDSYIASNFEYKFKVNGNTGTSPVTAAGFAGSTFLRSNWAIGQNYIAGLREGVSIGINNPETVFCIRNKTSYSSVYEVQIGSFSSALPMIDNRTTVAYYDEYLSQDRFFCFIENSGNTGIYEFRDGYSNFVQETTTTWRDFSLWDYYGVPVIVAFTASGLTSIPIPASGVSMPTSLQWSDSSITSGEITIDGDGNIFVAMGNYVKKLNSTGTLQWSCDVGGSTVSPAIIGKDGKLYVRIADGSTGTKIVCIG